MQQQKRIALVTGGNRGLGLETCRQLGLKGYRVILTARHSQQGEAKAKELQNEDLDVAFHPLDVNNPDSINAVYEYVLSNYGKLDVLINNAGILIDHTNQELDNLPQLLLNDTKVLEQTFHTNVVGPYLLSEAFGPIMYRHRYGRIVNVSSHMGQLAEMDVGYPAYRISKTAINAVTRIFASRYKPYVLVNSVCPGWVKTSMGGPNAPRSLSEGVDTILWAATLPDQSPSGAFFRDRQPITW
ncbi:MAG: SDR family oxidoreductase [Chlamydiia bacterium]|nr:SDR family oxidoreductase [Chlamydiia bacterium]